MYTLKINTLLDSEKVFDAFDNQWQYQDLYAVDVLDENGERIMTFSMLVETYTDGEQGHIFTLENWQMEQPKTLKALKNSSYHLVAMFVKKNSEGLTWLRDHCDIDYDLDFNFELIFRYLEGWREL